MRAIGACASPCAKVSDYEECRKFHQKDCEAFKACKRRCYTILEVKEAGLLAAKVAAKHTFEDVQRVDLDHAEAALAAWEAKQALDRCVEQCERRHSGWRETRRCWEDLSWSERAKAR